MVLDRLGGGAERLPVGEFGDRASSLLPDRMGGVGEVAAELGIGDRGGGCYREGGMPR
jgi:hypothetical protein